MAYAGTVRCTYGMVQLHTSGRYNICQNGTKSERYKNGTVHDFSLWRNAKCSVQWWMQYKDKWIQVKKADLTEPFVLLLFTSLQRIAASANWTWTCNYLAKSSGLFLSFMTNNLVDHVSLVIIKMKKRRHLSSLSARNTTQGTIAVLACRPTATYRIVLTIWGFSGLGPIRRG